MVDARIDRFGCRSVTRSAITAGASSMANIPFAPKPCGPVMRTRETTMERIGRNPRFARLADVLATQAIRAVSMHAQFQTDKFGYGDVPGNQNSWLWRQVRFNLGTGTAGRIG